MRKPVLIILIVAAFLLAAAGSFYGGMVYGKQQAGATFAAGLPPDGQAVFIGGRTGDGQGFRGRGQGGLAGGAEAQAGMTFGQIESIDGNTLMVTDRNGNDLMVQVAETTLIEKNASVSVEDLAIGDTVIVSGNTNDDGSVTARSVQVAPAGRLFGGPPGQAPSDQGQ